MSIITPSSISAALWTTALSMDPKPAVYGIRTAATTTTGADTFQYYQLQRVTGDPKKGVTIDEQRLASMSISTVMPRAVRIWMIYQRDLDTAAPITDGVQAPAPQPQVDYTLQINGQTWVIKKIESASLDQVWNCTCWLEQ